MGVLEGVISSDLLDYLKGDLETVARENVRQPMIFQMIGIECIFDSLLTFSAEKLKEQLEEFNLDAMEGDFGKLGDELILQIFGYLSPQDLGSLCRVSKRFKRLAEVPEVNILPVKSPCQVTCELKLKHLLIQFRQ